MADLDKMLRQVREADEQSEVQKNAENMTLHPSRIQEYLEDNEVNADNFDDKFNFQSALDILQMKRTRGEVKMEKELLAAKDYLDSLDADGADMMSDWDHDTFESDLNKLLEKYDAQEHASEINLAHQKYLLIRNLAFRRAQLYEKFETQREEEKVDVTKGLKDDFSGFWKDVKKNYKGMSKGEKVAAIGTLVLGTVWLFSKSDSPKVQAVKDGLWKAAKIIGAGIGLNYVTKLATGKTGLEHLDSWTGDTVASEGFWKESFKTDDKNAEILQRSFVYMEDKDVLDLAKAYRTARGSKSKKVEIAGIANSDMKPEEIYTALDTFFNRYPVETIEKKYKNEPRENRDWKTVTTTQMAEDGRLEMEGDLTDRMYEDVTYAINNSYNYLYGKGREVPKYAYEKWTGDDFEDIPPHKFKEWFQEYFEHKVQTMDDLKDHVSNEVRSKSAKNYQDMLEHGHHEKSVQYLKVGGDSVYAMTKVHLGNVGGNKNAIGEAWNKAYQNVEEFFGEQFPEYKSNVNKFILPETGACVVEENSFVLFARMPLPDTAEFSALNTGAKKNIDLLEEKSIEQFQGELRFGDLEKWEQDQFRVLYGLDSSQVGADTDKIFKEITLKYKALALPIMKVKEDVLNDEGLRDEMLKKADVEPGLRGNRALLDDIDEIEEDAASDIVAGRDASDKAIHEMKRMRGYKVRLAILGDKEARAEFNYDPNDEDAFENLKDDYIERCKKYVEAQSSGG